MVAKVKAVVRKKAAASVSNVAAGNSSDAEYAEFIGKIRARLMLNTENGARPLFTTDAEGLWELYLDSFEGSERQFHTCSACKRFIETFGALAVVEKTGHVASALWSEYDAPEQYYDVMVTLRRKVERSKITGVFLSSLTEWGNAVTGSWVHFAVSHPAKPWNSAVLTAGQKMAEKREDYATVSRALGEFKVEQLAQVVTLLEADALYRSEKVFGQAKWLHGVAAARAEAKGIAKSNRVWAAVATAPAGFCHPRSGMLSTLLDDIAAGMDFRQVADRFRAKMHPLQYQRPQEPPSAGTIRQAEAIVEKLKAAGSLERRYARIEEVQALWKPTPQIFEEKTGGVFDHLKAKGAVTKALDIPAQPITWVKFRDTVLAGVDRIEIQAPSNGPYSSLMTAVNPDAPPILQWDSEERRNPVSWYFWHNGASASQFGLSAGYYHEVAAITLKPSMWNGGFDHFGNGVFFIIKGAKESRHTGGQIFPETLRSEFHGVRSVIEAYSREATPKGAEEQSAAGLGFDFKSNSAVVRVWSRGQNMNYKIDRWD